jgi:hypothetical protein
MGMAELPIVAVRYVTCPAIPTRTGLRHSATRLDEIARLSRFHAAMHIEA